MSTPSRAELDGRIARTAHLGLHTKGATSADELNRASNHNGSYSSAAPNGTAPVEPKPLRPGSTTRAGGPTFIKATDLIAKDLPEPRWSVPGVLAEGLALLAGPLKIGKSWLALNLGIAIASGGVALGRIRVEGGDVLYLSLEDNERRLKARLVSVLGGERCPERLTLATQAPKLNEGLLSWLDAWAVKRPAGRLIVIDVLQKVRPPSAKNGSMYADDYKTVEGLQELAGRRRLTVLAVHHVRKMASDDPVETISGTQGLGGGADTLLILKRERTKRDATLYVTGRDVEEAQLTLRWDPAHTTWSVVADELSDERQAVIRVLSHAGRALGAKDISRALGRTYETTKLLCWRMANAGQLLTEGKGLYRCNPRTVETAETFQASLDLKVSAVTEVSTVSSVSGVSGVSGVQRHYNGWADQEPDLEEPEVDPPDVDPDELLEVAR